ncbi:50S ribosomal protein L18 [Striga asiatica]|uniref:50S ribosomal protein L18 n=1 Tax=Striga asiatica TaxID=4170 RepID=A0A5A7Q338_STRAF|nr:50S ribosomal protein L18 [Striga asiatica]
MRDSENKGLGCANLRMSSIASIVYLTVASEEGLALVIIEKKMTLLKRYVMRMFISLKYITANVVDRNNGRIVATASTVENALKSTLECSRTCNAKAAAVVGEVLAMRLRVEGLENGQGRGIYVDVGKEIERKGLQNRTKVWAIVNALKNNGVKLVLENV